MSLLGNLNSMLFLLVHIKKAGVWAPAFFLWFFSKQKGYAANLSLADVCFVN